MRSDYTLGLVALANRCAYYLPRYAFVKYIVPFALVTFIWPDK